mgnify:FL=1
MGEEEDQYSKLLFCFGLDNVTYILVGVIVANAKVSFFSRGAHHL